MCLIDEFDFYSYARNNIFGSNAAKSRHWIQYGYFLYGVRICRFWGIIVALSFFYDKGLTVNNMNLY
jgi:hypothetical protein